MTLPAALGEGFSLLLDSTFKASVIVVVASLSTALLRRRSAATRHMVWTSALLAVALLPILTLLMPSRPSKLGVSVPALFSVEQRVTMQPSAQQGVTVQAAFAPPPSAIYTPVSVAMLLWLSGCLTVIAVLIVEIVRLRRIGLRSEPVCDPVWISHAAELTRTFRLRRPVRILQNRAEPMLVTWGALSPRVLLPANADSWSEPQVRAVLGHELAHVGRADWLVQVVAEIVRSIYWFNPLLWYACSRLRQEGERACDDAVLSLGVEGTEYAAHVLEVARILKESSRRWSPALAMARHSNLERRFAAMLNVSLDRRAATRNAVVLTALAALCIMLPLSTLRSAQVQAGRFSGTIADANGGPSVNAIVVVSNVQAGFRQMTSTLADGRFDFQGVPTGQFAVTVLAANGERLQDAMTMQPSQNSQMDFRLSGVAPAGATKMGPGPQRSAAPASAPPPPPPPPPSSVNTVVQRIRQGGNVQSAMLMTQVPPVYPPDAKAAHVEGVVVLEGLIGNDGLVQTLRIVNDNVVPELGRAAVEAVSQWRYKPTLLNGNPVEVVTTITVNFAIGKR